MKKGTTAEPHGKDIWAWVGLRFLLAWIFLWGFLDKVFGLGFATKPGHAWIDGVSPTTGYLKFGSGGLFGDLFHGLANSVVVDVVFMASLLLIGVALLLGIGLKITAVAGTAFLAIMYLSNFPSAHNPIVEEHVIYIIVIVGIALAKAGRYLGLGRRWERTELVKRYRFLE